MKITLLPVPPSLTGWRLKEIERTRTSLQDETRFYVTSGVMHWRANDAVIPPHVFADAMVAPPAGQKAAYDREIAVVTARYRAQEASYRPTAEEKAELDFELRAAFGPGAEVINVLTGKRTRVSR